MRVDGLEFNSIVSGTNIALALHMPMIRLFAPLKQRSAKAWLVARASPILGLAACVPEYGQHTSLAAHAQSSADDQWKPTVLLIDSRQTTLMVEFKVPDQSPLVGQPRIVNAADVDCNAGLGAKWWTAVLAEGSRVPKKRAGRLRAAGQCLSLPLLNRTQQVEREQHPLGSARLELRTEFPKHESGRHSPGSVGLELRTEFPGHSIDGKKPAGVRALELAVGEPEKVQIKGGTITLTVTRVTATTEAIKRAARQAYEEAEERGLEPVEIVLPNPVIKIDVEITQR